MPCEGINEWAPNEGSLSPYDVSSLKARTTALSSLYRLVAPGRLPGCHNHLLEIARPSLCEIEALTFARALERAGTRRCHRGRRR